MFDYKNVGDKIYIKPVIEVGITDGYSIAITKPMLFFAGMEVTITKKGTFRGESFFNIREDDGRYMWPYRVLYNESIYNSPTDDELLGILNETTDFTEK